VNQLKKKMENEDEIVNLYGVKNGQPIKDSRKWFHSKGYNLTNNKLTSSWNIITTRFIPERHTKENYLPEDDWLRNCFYKLDEYAPISEYGKAKLSYKESDNSFKIECLDYIAIRNLDNYSSYSNLLKDCRELNLIIPKYLLK